MHRWECFSICNLTRFTERRKNKRRKKSERFLRAILHERQKPKLKILLFQNFTFLGVFACYTGQFCLKTKKKKLKFLSRLQKRGNPAIAKSNFLICNFEWSDLHFTFKRSAGDEVDGTSSHSTFNSQRRQRHKWKGDRVRKEGQSS